ncbi:MAG: hypothetical protein CSA65_07845 [Proteobacteria bacterium]|nr:MAG: hypothetical protein CSA65_07845 [Pseudomonadota bacterium]
MKICTTCSQLFSGEIEFCPQDNTKLVDCEKVERSPIEAFPSSSIERLDTSVEELHHDRSEVGRLVKTSMSPRLGQRTAEVLLPERSELSSNAPEPSLSSRDATGPERLTIPIQRTSTNPTPSSSGERPVTGPMPSSTNLAPFSSGGRPITGPMPSSGEKPVTGPMPSTSQMSQRATTGPPRPGDPLGSVSMSMARVAVKQKQVEKAGPVVEKSRIKPRERETVSAGESEEAPLEAGSKLGDYRILGLLSEGGVGRIYRAEDIRGREVALKLLHREYAFDAVTVTRFFAEAHAVNQIRHENIIEITNFIEDVDGDNYYTMEILSGETLAKRLEAGPLDLPAVAHIGAQIASALAAVHASEIIHRDLKPDNIFLIERDGQRDYVKLLGFGVAKLLARHSFTSLAATTPGTVLGTPEYMSPEQASATTIDHRSDIYALGLVLFELVTGKKPFVGENYGDLVVQRLTEDPPSPKDLRADCSEALERLILDCLEREPDDRPQGAEDVERRLRELALTREPEQEFLIASGDAGAPKASSATPPKAETELEAAEPLPVSALGLESPPTGATADVTDPSLPALKVRSSRRLAIVAIVGITLMGVIAALWLMRGALFGGRDDKQDMLGAASSVDQGAAVARAPDQGLDTRLRARAHLNRLRPDATLTGATTLTLLTRPAGARVYEAGSAKLLGRTPCSVSLRAPPRARVLVFRLDGHHVGRHKLVLSPGQMKVRLRLRRRGAKIDAPTGPKGKGGGKLTSNEKGDEGKPNSNEGAKGDRESRSRE